MRRSVEAGLLIAGGILAYCGYIYLIFSSHPRSHLRRELDACRAALSEDRGITEKEVDDLIKEFTK